MVNQPTPVDRRFATGRNHRRGAALAARPDHRKRGPDRSAVRRPVCAATMPTMPSDIAAAARHLLSVIRSMNGETEQDRDRVDLVALATETIGLLEPTARAKGVTVVSEASRQVLAQGDTRGVIQILVNLLGNAVRHSPEGGTVTVTFDRTDGFARAHVTDQGPGIDARGPAANFRALRAGAGRRRRHRARPCDRSPTGQFDERRRQPQE